MAVSPRQDDSDPATPPPLRERPPDDRFCDLVLTGGVASGVVYPWAVVELARHYRFRSIGGNSVGAMAAALAAAAEYGRCCGQPHAFEVLRQSPRDLAEEDEHGDTRMLRLFQPAAGVRRLFECALIGIRHFNDTKFADDEKLGRYLLTLRDVLGRYHLALAWLAGVLLLLVPALLLLAQPLAWGAAIGLPVLLALAERWQRNAPRCRARIVIALLGVLALVHLGLIALLLHARLRDPQVSAADCLFPLFAPVGWSIFIVLALALMLRPELRAFKDNSWGFCAGKAQPDEHGELSQKALVEWLHEGIQRSAGRDRDQPPVTFADLWSAPRSVPLQPGEASITLQVFSTNVTLGRPVVWPLRDRNQRLFYRYEEWQRFFPPTLLDALWGASPEYRPASDSDPQPGLATQGLRELPAGGMPIAIAARLSLSFPVLFSCIPVYAIDYEQPHDRRQLRKCQLTDGGICTNFPIYLFDAAHPRWPTFGLLLARRLVQHERSAVWLPEYHTEGRADNWSHGVPGAELPQRPDAPPPEPTPVRGLAGLLSAMVGTALDWNDNLLARLPHVRNRVLRMALRSGEGQLHITMPRSTILRMAQEYGTHGGRLLVKRFVAAPGQPKAAWQEHLYVRALNELRALARRLRGYPDAVAAAGFNKPLARILADAVDHPPLRQRSGRTPDPTAAKLTPQQAASLQAAVDAVTALARELEKAGPDLGPYEPVPETHLHLRSQI